MQHEIDWDDLRTLISVARAGSLAGAAGALGSHRSTVLRRIERLEARLGLRLFDRTPQGLVLTAAGERVSPNAELMSDAVDEILRSVEADHGRPAGHIRLATTFNLAFGLLPCPIDRFRLAYPEIMVEVIGTLDGYSTIHPDQFDLALRTLDRDPAGHEQMVGRRLGKLQLAIYGSKSYFADRPIPKSPKRLRQHKLLLGCSGLADLAAFRWLELRMTCAGPIWHDFRCMSAAQFICTKCRPDSIKKSPSRGGIASMRVGRVGTFAFSSRRVSRTRRKGL